MLNSLLSNGNSKINNSFSAYLLEKGIKFEKEFVLEPFVYDFRIENYLIELDPSATHAVDFAPANWKPKTETYHREKTLNALTNGLFDKFSAYSMLNYMCN